MSLSGDDSLIEVGRIVKPHGVRGALKLHLYNPASEALQRCDTLTVRQGGASWTAAFKVEGPAGALLVITLEGVEGREAAERLRGAVICVPRDRVAPDAEDEYLYADLMGCAVLDEEGQALGVVFDIFSAGAADVLVVRSETEERMIPLVDDWVVAVDLESRQIQITGADQFDAELLKEAEEPGT